MSAEKPFVTQEEPAERGRLSRRAVVGSTAWSVPVISLATAAPAFASSGATALAITSPPGKSATPTNRTSSQTVTAQLTGPSVASRVITFSITTTSPNWLSFSNAGTVTTTTASTDGTGAASVTLYFGSVKPTPGALFGIKAEYGTLSDVGQVVYTPNVTVLSIAGTTSANVSGAVSVREYEQAGGAAQAAVNTVSFESASLTTRRLTNTPSAGSHGSLMLSPNRKYLAAAGYDAVAGTATPTTTASGTVNRSVGFVTTSGTSLATSISASYTDAYSGNTSTSGSPRSAVTSDGTNIWMGGNGSSNPGVRYSSASASATTSTQVAAGNVRWVSIVDGQLYVSASTGINAVGSGTPTGTGQTLTPIFTPAAASPYGYALLDRSTAAGATGIDTAYVADDGAVTTNGGIWKYTKSGGSWSAGTRVYSGSPIVGLTGYVLHDGSAVLFATSSDGTSLFKLTDTGVYTSTTSIAATQIGTAGAANVFRGVAMVPDVSA